MRALTLPRRLQVQENCIDLVGRIADRGAEFVPAREWMRICFELLDMLKAHKKGIRRATVNTFGYIAKAIGPQDVLVTLLNNLKVQERQNRVCTTVAIAIVAETCSPFTVLPALMNEYKVRPGPGPWLPPLLCPSLWVASHASCMQPICALLGQPYSQTLPAADAELLPAPLSIWKSGSCAGKCQPALLQWQSPQGEPGWQHHSVNVQLLKGASKLSGATGCSHAPAAC